MTQTTTSCLTWSPELQLGDARTDATHEEFIVMLNATASADAATQLTKYQELVEHTVEHFAQEERWMRACDIPEDFCHFTQHTGVLEVMKEIERRALLGETELIAKMLEALVEWFPGHAQSMDAGLVTYLKEKGFDTTSETFTETVTDKAIPELNCH
jgi:hemerythrin